MTPPSPSPNGGSTTCKHATAHTFVLLAGRPPKLTSPLGPLRARRERCELDLVNTCQTFPFERVSCDELGSTPNLLRAMGNALSAEIYGAVIESDEDKVKLARSIRGSGYLLRLEGAYKDE